MENSSKNNKDTEQNTYKMADPVALGHALMHAYEKAAPLMEEYMEKYTHKNAFDEFCAQDLDPMNLRQSYIAFWERVLADPSQFLGMQTSYMNDWMLLWQESVKKFMGQKGETVIEPEAGDRRFKASEWQESALFDFIKQSYLLTCRWMDKTVHNIDGIDLKDRQKLAFGTKLFANALSPTNFVLTNPEVLNETLRTGGENLVKGLENLIDDLERGKGELKIKTTDYDSFELGKNIAVTPGDVVFQNELMQLIQFRPLTAQVFKRPLLIVPPWINKYYILDLRPDNSFIRWAVSQGHTVFVVSWVNPGPELADKTFEDYMHQGILESLYQIEKVTSEKSINVIGYCLGGTLLSITLSYLAAQKQQSRIHSATFFTTLLDFEHAGDLKLFLDEQQVDILDQKMSQTGILEGKTMQQTFSLLRANDLIWSFVVNNYLMGKEPFPFDLLYWNDDSTNMPAAMHSFYLRKMYLENALIKKGGIVINEVPIDLKCITTPAFFLSTREDHIAPWKATYEGTKLIAGPVTFTLAASGHIAGVINPPDKKKYCYWVNKGTPLDADQWLENADQHEGSWWPFWQEWINQFAGELVDARPIVGRIEAAPGSYVKKRL